MKNDCLSLFEREMCKRCSEKVDVCGKVRLRIGGVDGLGALAVEEIEAECSLLSPSVESAGNREEIGEEGFLVAERVEVLEGLEHRFTHEVASLLNVARHGKGEAFEPWIDRFE